jgi:hypothetical protein
MRESSRESGGKGGQTGKVTGEEGLRALRLAYDVLKEIETS